MKKTTDHFGVELEFTGISRQAAANVLGRVFDANVQYSRASDVYFVADADGFLWQIAKDTTISPESAQEQVDLNECRCELITPICSCDRLSDIQRVVIALRSAGMKVNSTCGIHVHVDETGHDVESLYSLIQIMACSENTLFNMLEVPQKRVNLWCRPVSGILMYYIRREDPHYISMQDLQESWYAGCGEDDDARRATRNHALNLDSMWHGKGIEFRMFNSTTDENVVTAYIMLALALNIKALNHHYAAYREKCICANNLTQMRRWLYHLGLTGEKYADVRRSLLSHIPRKTNRKAA